MLKKIEIALWIASAMFAYAVFLTIIYSDFLVFYEKILGAIIPVMYINAAGVHIWRRIK